MALLCLLFATSVLGQAEGQAGVQGEPKNVLLLYSYGHGGKGIGVFDSGLLDTLGAAGVSTNNLYFEYLDLERNAGNPRLRQELRTALLNRYALHRIDLIVTVQQPALNFLLQEGRELAPGVPAITVHAPLPSVDEAGDRRFVGLVASFDIQGTLERALDLFPDTERVLIVSGASDADKKMAQAAAQASAPWAGRLTFEYTTELSLAQLLDRVGKLPPHAIILFTQHNRDASGKVTVAYEVEGMIVKAANAPVFGLYDFNLANGGVGGSVISVRSLGERTANLALELLGGRRHLAEPVSSATLAAVPMFDWAQLKRLGGRLDRLPGDAVFVNRLPTFWAQYRPYVIGLAAFLLLQSALIAGLLLNMLRRRRAESALRESEREFRTLAEAMPQIVWVTRADGWSVYFNQRWVDYTGLTLEQSYGHGWNKPFHPDDQQRAWDAWQNAVHNHGTYALECRLRKADGSYRWWLIRGVPVHDANGAIEKWFGTCTDIHDFKQVDEALSENRSKLEAALSSMGDAVSIADRDGRFIHINDAFASFHKFASKDACPKTLAEYPALLELYSSDGEALPVEQWAVPRALRGEAAIAMEFTLHRRDSSASWVGSYSFAPIRDQHGAVVGAVVTARDITASKEAENEIRKLNITLEQRVQQRTAELEVANRSLSIAKAAAEGANVAKSNFLANMSHEIRTPMNGILGMANLLRRGGVTPSQAKRLDAIDASGKLLLGIINDILDLSKIEAGKLTLEDAPVAISGLLNNVASIMAEAAQAKGIALLVAEAVVPQGLLGDATRLQQALLNYATNAIKFTEKGAVELRVRVQEETQSSVLLRFEVQDSGIGIDAQALTRLFGAFEQVDTSISRKYGGTGLGLVITRRLAELMGGEAGAESTPGLGSVFWFSARLQRGSERASAPAKSTIDAEAELRRRFSGSAVLLVDDEPMNREIATLLLEDSGLAVDAAEDGATAIAMAGVKTYAVILMDMQMPKVNGLDATRQIRSLPGYSETPIVAMTANVFTEDKRRCFEAGMNDFLIKPFKPQDLFETLLRWLARGA